MGTRKRALVFSAAPPRSSYRTISFGVRPENIALAGSAMRSRQRHPMRIDGIRRSVHESEQSDTYGDRDDSAPDQRQRPVDPPGRKMPLLTMTMMLAALSRGLVSKAALGAAEAMAGLKNHVAAPEETERRLMSASELAQLADQACVRENLVQFTVVCREMKRLAPHERLELADVLWNSLSRGGQATAAGRLLDALTHSVVPDIRCDASIFTLGTSMLQRFSHSELAMHFTRLASCANMLHDPNLRAEYLVALATYLPANDVIHGCRLVLAQLGSAKDLATSRRVETLNRLGNYLAVHDRSQVRKMLYPYAGRDAVPNQFTRAHLRAGLAAMERGHFSLPDPRRASASKYISNRYQIYARSVSAEPRSA